MSGWIRRIGYVLGALVLIVVALSGFVFYKSSNKLHRKYVADMPSIAFARDSLTLVRGEHLVTVLGKCVDCHTADLGGKVFIDDPALGRIVAPNLTNGDGGIGTVMSDAAMAAAIRTGIKHDSTSALVMPSDEYQNFTDDDVAAIVTYVRSLPAVNRTLPVTTLRPVGRALSVAGQLPIFMAEEVPPHRTYAKSIVADTSLAYGAYLSTTGGCTGCHGPGLSGGKIPGTPPEWPPAANISPTGIGRYSDQQLITMLRTGKRPDGTVVNEVMPWKYTARMTDDEMTATIRYLRSMPPKASGGR